MARAMVLEEFGQPLVLREIPLPELEPGAVLLRLQASGICGSDLDIVAGDDPRVPVPLIPGHEGIGEIAAINGPRTDIFGEPLTPGDLIAFDRGVPCGYCPWCTLHGEPALCPHRKTYGISLSAAEWPYLNGCYADHVYLRPEIRIIKLPPDADPQGLVAATCSGATAAHAVELAGIQPAGVVVVFGPGPLGLFAAAFAFQRGADQVVIIGTGRSPRRLELAEAFGCVPVSLNHTSFEDRLELVRGYTHGFGAQAVIDCAGTASSVTESLALAAPGATVTIPGVAIPLPDLTLDPYVLSRRQIRLQGVWTSNTRHLHQALTLANSRRYPLDALVTHVLPLEQANEGLQLLRDKQAIKVVLG